MQWHFVVDSFSNGAVEDVRQLHEYMISQNQRKYEQIPETELSQIISIPKRERCLSLKLGGSIQGVFGCRIRDCELAR